MSMSVKDAHHLQAPKYPFVQVCAWILSASAILFLAIGTIGFIGMERSPNPFFVALLDGSLASMCVLFIIAVIASFTLHAPRD